MKKLIEQIKFKIATCCNEKTKEGRARKGAYVDCIVMAKELNLWSDSDMIEFQDWIDNKIIAGQINRLKDERIKWFYNHKPEAPEGKQLWNSYTTSDLLTLFRESRGKRIKQKS